MAQKRCVVMFMQAIGSPHTREIYKYHLDKFMVWNKTEDYDDLLKADEKSIQRNLEDYLIHLKDKYSPNYIPSIIAPVELFYTMNDVNLNSKRLHKMFPTKTKKGGYGSYTKEDISSMLENTNKKRTRALILFLSSTGCRAGVIPELKLSHITNIDDCKQVVCYAESNEEYVTFMTPEASKAFDDYLEERQQDHEKLKPESPAFRKNYVIGSTPAETMLTETVRSAINMTLKNIRKTKSGNRFNISALHGFRKFFNVTLKSRYDCNLSLCEKLMGHSVTIPLDNAYGAFSTEKIFEEYKKSIPELTIDDSIRLQEENKIKETQIKKLETDKDERISNLEKKLNQVSDLLERVNLLK